MNWPISAEEFARLPFRDDVKGEYVSGGLYRARAYPSTVFIWRGSNHYAAWDSFGVDLSVSRECRICTL